MNSIIRIFALVASLAALTAAYELHMQVAVPQCPCSIFPSCSQAASTSLSSCVTACHNQPPLQQDDCLVTCNLHFQSTMQETRTCPAKACSACAECAPMCSSALASCKQQCGSSAACAANCTKGHDACAADMVPCAVPAPASTPAPTPPAGHVRDMPLINALTQQALALTDGVYFSTAPHVLPHKGVTTIGKGEFLQSPSGVFVLQFLDNGDLGLFAGAVQTWTAPRTAGRGTPGHIDFDPQTGVMTMYSSTNTVWWDSRTIIRPMCMQMPPYDMPRCIPRPVHVPAPNGKAPYELRVADHGNVEITDSNGKVFFESATSNQGLLISDVTAKAEYATGLTTTDNLIGFLGQWTQVPVDVRIQFEAAAFAQEDQWEIFSLNFSPAQGHVEEWVGAAKQSNGTISLLYIHLLSTGNPVQQYTPVQVPSCHRCWFHTCCSTHTVEVKRGFLADELLSMVISLRRAGFFALENIIATL